MSLLVFIIAPIILSLIAYFIPIKFSKLLTTALNLALFSMAIFVFVKVYNGGVYIVNMGGYDKWQGINLVADRISILFILLTTFLFMLLYIYAYNERYMNHLFIFLFMLLEGLICGIFLVDDLFSLYALIEVSTVCVAILIMFKKSNQSIYDGMLYLLINIVGMNFYLLGGAYIYKIFGTLNFGVLRHNITVVPSRELIIPYALLITAVGLKSAIMPLFSWLPKAHGTPSAPSVVSAILSALYVKGGVYLIIRLNNIFSQAIEVGEVFVILGFMTGLIGFVLALSQTDIKLILAYHTVSQIGLIIFGLSLHSYYSYYGAVYHIINHAVFKSALFLTAGIIYDEYGTRDIRKIRGVFRRMPFVGIIILVSILGITGAPLFNGSISKYLISKGTVMTNFYEIALEILNIGTILSFVKYSNMLFGKTKEKSSVSKNKLFAIGVLALITFIGGAFGEYLVEFFFNFPLQIKTADKLIKFGVYIFNLGIGILFYVYLYPKIAFFKKIRNFELSFNEIVMSILIFFVVFTSYLYVVI